MLYLQTVYHKRYYLSTKAEQIVHKKANYKGKCRNKVFLYSWTINYADHNSDRKKFKNKN